MIPLSSINSPSEDGELIQQVVKRGLIGLSFAIIALSSAALWTVVQLTGFYQDEVNIIIEQDRQLHVMRIAARERSLLLYAMLTGIDPFLNDDKRMAIYSSGAKFTRARIKLLNTSLPPDELELLNKQGELSKVVSPIHDQVVDLIIKGDTKSALYLLQEQAIPGQNKVMQILEQIHTSLQKKNNEVKIKADSIVTASILILIAIVIIIIIGAFYIIRQTTYRTFNIVEQLNQTRDLLQKTIYELIQQKDTLDHHAIVSIADRQGKITYINNKFCEISGYGYEELIGTNHRVLKSDVHEDEFYHQLWTTISQGKVWHGKICNKRKDGSLYWVESTISPFLDDKGIPYQYVSVRTDITDLLEAKLKAEEASRSKSIFLSSMSHELRTPMNAILGFSQLIEMKNKDEVIKDFNQEIIHSGTHLLDLINEILDLSKIESGKIELFIESCSLKNILEFCLVMIIPAADKRSIRVNNKVDLLPDININVDEKRFKQVVINLISNAVKYNKEKGSLSIDYSVENNEILCLSISDTGKGIAIEQQNNIFNPFDRAGEETSNTSGTGLGLAISKNLIEMMGGSIGFKSIENKGSQFWIKIPVS